MVSCERALRYDIPHRGEERLKERNGSGDSKEDPRHMDL